jgi:hypothetical protein
VTERLHGAWQRTLDVDDPLTALRAARELKEALVDHEVALARAALAKGETWESIGAALGVTRQAAWERLRRGIAAAIEEDRKRVEAERDRLQEKRRTTRWKTEKGTV